MNTYTVEQLREILAAHQVWQKGNGGARADLSRANLSGANLYGAKYGNFMLRGFLQVGPIGSREAILQVFGVGYDGFIFNTGCFSGSAEEFAEAIARTHDGSDHAKNYLAAIDFAKTMLPPALEEQPIVATEVI